MKITLTAQESEEYFFNALCNGLSYMRGYGLSIDYLDSDYQQAKANFLKEHENSPSYEDVLIQILKDGNTLTLVDDENGGEYSRWINIHDVHDRTQSTPVRHLLDMENKSDDVDTADAILQTVFYNEIIFG